MRIDSLPQNAPLLRLSQDVLDAHVRGYLDKESALHFNEAIPSRRLVRRFPRNYAQEHHDNTMISKWAQMINAANEVPLNDARRRRIYRVLQDLGRPVNVSVVLSNLQLRLTLLVKLQEFMNTASDSGGSRKWTRMFVRLCARTYALLAM
jgi:hypothetical protein